MLLFFQILVFAIFLFLNGKILWSDVRYKRIPNRHLLQLLCLLPFFYGIDWIMYGAIPPIIAIGVSFLIALLCSFLLYYYGVWSAWDAKYLLVLSLFLGTIGIIPFIGNLALITMLYLFGYYLYFYLRMIFRGKQYIQSTWGYTLIDIKTAAVLFIKKRMGSDRKSTVIRWLKFFLVFLVLFVGIRLSRSYLIEELQSIEMLRVYLRNYPTYTIFGIGLACIIPIYLGRWIIKNPGGAIRKYAIQRGWIVDIELVIIVVFLALLLGFIGFELTIHPEEIIHKLFLIFTVYLALFAIVKVLFYSYHLTFQLSERTFIPIDQLESGSIIDKEPIAKIFQYNEGVLKKSSIFPEGAEYYIQNLENPISDEDITRIKNAITLINQDHKKKKTPGFQELRDIGVLNTFAFASYILTGFLLTYFLAETPIQILIQTLTQIFHHLIA